MEKVSLKQTIIKLDGVRKSYFIGEIETRVLNNASLEVREGDFVVILGPSGCGKTTFLNLIGGLDKPSEGKVFVINEDISKKDNNYLADFRKRQMGFIFQFYNLMPTLTALENIEISLEILKLDRQQINTRAIEYLRKVGLENKKDSFPSQLSGGEQQRVAIARALAKKPKIVLADEPTGNLDEKTEHEITNLMLGLNKELGITFLVVTHNQHIAESADHVIKIRDGQIYEESFNSRKLS